MPLLIAVVALGATLLLGVLLGVIGLVRRPFAEPGWRPAFAWPLALRAVLLTLGVLVAVAVAAWRHPVAVPGLGLGLAAGLALGAGAAVTTELRRRGRFVEQRPHRLFFALLAVAVLARTALAAAGEFAALPTDLRPAMPMLAGLLAGYPLAHALVLRHRLRRFARLQPAA